MKTPPTGSKYHTGAPVWRQTTALLYDLLLVASLWWLAAASVTLVGGGGAEPGTVASQLVLLVGGGLHLGYFCLFWRLSGQTIGMRAWRLHLLRTDGHALGWRQCLARALLAVLLVPPLAIGWLWALFDRDRCSLQDRLCRTRILLRQ